MDTAAIRTAFADLDRDVPEALNKALLAGDPTWDTQELQRDFTVEGFQAPFVVVRHKETGVRGSLRFIHAPRVYFGFEAV